MRLHDLLAGLAGPEGAGTPALWPWMQVVSSLLRLLDIDERTELLATELGDLLTVRNAGSAACERSQNAVASSFRAPARTGEDSPSTRAIHSVGTAK